MTTEAPVSFRMEVCGNAKAFPVQALAWCRVLWPLPQALYARFVALRDVFGVSVIDTLTSSGLPGKSYL